MAKKAAECCDNGWRHLCGGPHDDPAKIPADCETVRCTTHCSCGAPEGEHHPDCARA